MDKDLHDTIGNTVDALLRPQTAPPADGVLRVAVLRSGDADAALAEYARAVGLAVVYVNQCEDVGDISVYDQIPPFDILIADLPNAEQDTAFAFALRFLRVRRPVAFVLAGENASEFAPQVQDKTQRLGYRVYGQRAFVVGALWPQPFSWPTELTAKAVMEQVAQVTLAHAGG